MTLPKAVPPHFSILATGLDRLSLSLNNAGTGPRQKLKDRAVTSASLLLQDFIGSKTGLAGVCLSPQNRFPQARFGQKNHVARALRVLSMNWRDAFQVSRPKPLPAMDFLAVDLDHGA
jgi:hypothetical protein